MILSTKHILGLEHLSAKDITLILDTAHRLKKQNFLPVSRERPLQGKTVINLFHEPSTRTRISFEMAGKILGAHVINFTAGSSSLVKGESLKDTIMTLQALSPQITVIRHSAPGILFRMAPLAAGSIINAGDGAHEHPTQALLDMLTIREHFGTLAGLRVAIVGDITHSRVARSNLWGLTTMGCHVRVAGPATMLPPNLDDMGAAVFLDVDEAITDVDVVICLRIQRERQSEALLPSLKEYTRFFGIDEARLQRANRNAIVLHPGPINRGVEISSAVADGKQSCILKQVANGLAVRTALFCLLAGKGVDHVAH